MWCIVISALFIEEKMMVKARYGQKYIFGFYNAKKKHDIWYNQDPHTICGRLLTWYELDTK